MKTIHPVSIDAGDSLLRAIESRKNWDGYFMSLMFLVSMKSKDQSTKIGAVIVSPENEIISTGFNGFPRGCDDEVKERHERPLKYSWFAHGERNSIYAAAKLGHALNGCRMYTQGTPCSGCAVAIIQSGIKEVIVSSLWEDSAENRKQTKWKEEALISKEMFQEAGVKLRIYDGPLVSEITGRFDGSDIKLI